MNRIYSFLLIVFLALILFGCSGGTSSPIGPTEDKTATSPGDGARQSWGMWQFKADPATGTLEVVPLRGAELHLNALNFVEPPPNVYLTLEGAPHFNGNILDVDIGLRHPFIGLDQFTGFDVCGVLISDGSITGFASDPGLILPGSNDTRLINADGYARWWNPTEFPPNPDAPILGYKDGELGTPDSVADYSATINGYKYFADGLAKDDSISSLDVNSRGVFNAGNKNIRHYTISIAGGLVFNYAIDANWKMPVGSPPYDVPGDFGEGANRPEAWDVIATEVENTLNYSEGIGYGHLLLNLDVYDWFGADLNQVVVESKAGISPVTATSPIGGGTGFSTYEVDLPGTALETSGDIDLLITVKSEKFGYQGLLPGKAISSYFIHPTVVGTEPPTGNLEWFYDDAKAITDNNYFDRSPSLYQRTTYDLDIGFLRLEDYGGGSSNASAHMLTSSDNGANITYAWHGNAYHGGQELKDLKACADPFGNTTFMYQSWYPIDTLYTHASTARKPDFVYWDVDKWRQENEGIYIPNSEHTDEVFFAADNKVVVMADREGQIVYKKGTDEFSLYYNHSWTDWSSASETLIVDGRLGETRDIAIDSSGAVHFAYFTDDGPWVKMRSNPDGMGTDWSGDVYITAGLTDEYVSRVEPSLDIDPDGKFHSTFIGVIEPKYDILYASSSDGTDWSGYKQIFSSPDAPLSEVTVDTFLYNPETLVIVVSFVMNGDVWFISSLDGGSTFSSAVMISDGTNNSMEPDILADAQGYVHFAWAQKDQELGQWDDYDIHYRRAYLVESGG